MKTEIVVRGIERNVIARFNYNSAIEHSNMREITVKGKMYLVVHKDVEFREDKMVINILIHA